MGIAAAQANKPSHLLWDADATFQLLITQQHDLLRRLASEAGLPCILVPEVEVELRSSKKFGSAFAGPLKKLLHSGKFKILDYGDLQSLPGVGSKAIAQAVEVAIAAKGRAYALRIQTGEAYSHAAGVSLSLPLVSNDHDAIQTLVEAGLPTAQPTLRFFDVLCFAHQKGWLTEAECNGVCKQLRQASEFVPTAFAQSSFKKGMAVYQPRLIASSSGISPPAAKYPHQQALVI